MLMFCLNRSLKAAVIQDITSDINVCDSEQIVPVCSSLLACLSAYANYLTGCLAMTAVSVHVDVSRVKRTQWTPGTEDTLLVSSGTTGTD